MQVTGRVFRCYEKEWPSRKPGGKSNKTYSIKLEDDSIYYRTPRPKSFGDGERFAGTAEPGNLVRFEADPINETSAQITGPVTLVDEQKSKANVTKDMAPGTTGTASLGVAPAYGAGRDASIQYQSSRKDALEFVSLAVTAGAVKLPAKEALKLQALEALVDHYTAGFYADIETKGAVVRAAGEEETPASEPAKPAADDAE